MDDYDIYDALDTDFLNLKLDLESKDEERRKNAIERLRCRGFHQFICFYYNLGAVMIIRNFTVDEIFRNLSSFVDPMTKQIGDFSLISGYFPVAFVRSNFKKFLDLYPGQAQLLIKAAGIKIHYVEDLDFLLSAGISYDSLIRPFKQSDLWEYCSNVEILFRCIDVFLKHGVKKSQIQKDLLNERCRNWQVDEVLNRQRWESYC